MGRFYEQVYEGRWGRYTHRNQRIMCCDCSLVHILNFRIRKRRLEIQVFRDNRSTAASRRENGIKIVKTPKRPKRR